MSGNIRARTFFWSCCRLVKLSKFNFEEVLLEYFVMTTRHEDEPLDEVFKFSKTYAKHPVARLDQTAILHIAAANQGKEC
jgi:hypothetical protein